MKKCVALLGLAAALLGWLPRAVAHQLNMTRVMVTSPAAGEVTVQIDIDLSLMLGSTEGYTDLLRLAPPAQRPRLESLGQQALHEVGVRLDGQLLALKPEAWTLPDTAPERIGDQTTASMTTFKYRQQLAAGPHEVTVSPGAMAKIEFPLAYTFAIPAQNLLLTRWLELPGGLSRVLKIPEALAPAGPVTQVASGVAPAAKPAAVPAAAALNAGDYSPTELAIARFISTFWQHLVLGFHHIFPQGADHILFVLGLFFLGAQWRPLLSQTTAFTIAHTTTLGLSSYGIISLPTRIVEPAIALSIAYVAIENICRPKLGPARIAIVFCFGLLHGLGFASSLSEVPLPRDQFFTALLAFNFGVDFGQLFVIAMAFLAVGWFRNQPWYRPRVVVPACIIIAAVGLYWTVTRIFS